MYDVLLNDTLILEMSLFYVTGCNVYTYGLDCIYCGNCSGGVQCNHVTGTCPNGCNAGIYGDKCDVGNLKIDLFFFLFNKKISALNVKLCCFSTNCIFWMKQLKILLQERPHSIAFKNVIRLYYFFYSYSSQTGDLMKGKTTWLHLQIYHRHIPL